jgi:predicted transcriptional regulator
MLRSVDLVDYMVTNPVTVQVDADIYEAIHLILVHKISGLCVVDENNNFVGVLSELDCLRQILSAIYNETGECHVRDCVVTENVVTAGLHDDIVDVAADMLQQKHRRRPVLQDGKLVGQITCRQLLRAVKEFRVPKDPTEYYLSLIQQKFHPHTANFDNIFVGE